LGLDAGSAEIDFETEEQAPSWRSSWTAMAFCGFCESFSFARRLSGDFLDQRQHPQRAAAAVDDLERRGDDDRPGRGELIEVA